MVNLFQRFKKLKIKIMSATNKYCKPCLQAHCQSPASQRLLQSFDNKPANPAPLAAFMGGLKFASAKKELNQFRAVFS